MKKRTKIELIIFAAVAVFYLGSLFAESRGHSDDGIGAETASVESFTENGSSDAAYSGLAAAEISSGSTAGDSALSTAEPDAENESTAGIAAGTASGSVSEETLTEGNAASGSGKAGSADTTVSTDGGILPYAGSNMHPLDGVPAESADSISEDGSYTDRDSVAMYIAAYGHLPGNYITKAEAKKAGWISEDGNLAEVCPGKSIGGDRFGNYEGSLPDKEGRKYFECDINYDPNNGYRGGERIIYSNDGLIYYTADHYKIFDKLYGEE